MVPQHVTTHMAVATMSVESNRNHLDESILVEVELKGKFYYQEFPGNYIRLGFRMHSRWRPQPIRTQAESC